MPQDEEYIGYRTVAQAILGLLLLIATGAYTYIFNTLSDHASRLNASDKWMTQLQDTQNEYAWRVQKNETDINNLKSQKAEESEVADLKAQLATMQRQLDTDQIALHDLSDAFTREFPLKHYR